jgi:DNA-binding NarL/FixJ family response regulator
MEAAGTKSPRSIRVLLVDDQQQVRLGLEALLETCHDIKVVGRAASGVEALEQARQLLPDLVLMDCRMPTMDGVEATRRIKEALPRTVVVALSMYADLEPEARAAGADSFLVKGCLGRDIVEEIRRVAGSASLAAGHHGA